MEPRQEFIIAIVSIAMGGSVVLTAITSAAKVLSSRRKRDDPGAIAQVDARLERMEVAIEAMAVEMERLGEGQRFTTKLLAEGRGAAAEARAAVPERVGDAPLPNDRVRR